MMQVPQVKQALRYAVSDLKGAELLPGLCLPKKVSEALQFGLYFSLHYLPTLFELISLE